MITIFIQNNGNIGVKKCNMYICFTCFLKVVMERQETGEPIESPVLVNVGTFLKNQKLAQIIKLHANSIHFCVINAFLMHNSSFFMFR